MKFELMLGAAFCALFAAAPAATAHHSVGGQFDLQQELILSGVITKVNWVNPHIYVLMDVKDKDGKVATWRLEGVPVAMARKAGLTKAMLMGNGEPITVLAHPARDGTPHLGYIVKLTYPDGKFYQFKADK